MSTVAGQLADKWNTRRSISRRPLATFFNYINGKRVFDAHDVDTRERLWLSWECALRARITTWKAGTVAWTILHIAVACPSTSCCNSFLEVVRPDAGAPVVGKQTAPSATKTESGCQPHAGRTVERLRGQASHDVHPPPRLQSVHDAKNCVEQLEHRILK